MTVQIDMQEVMNETVQELGAQIGQLTLELKAQQRVNRALHEQHEADLQRIAELEAGPEEKDAAEDTKSRPRRAG